MGLITGLHDYRLALASPLVTAHGVVDHREGLLFSISDGANVGWGEAAPMPGWSRESLSDCKTTLEAAASRVAHLDSVDDPRFGAILAELEAQPHARSALAGAAFDLLARSHEVSIASLLEASTSPGWSAEPWGGQGVPRAEVTTSPGWSAEPWGGLGGPRAELSTSPGWSAEGEAPRSVLVNGLISQRQPEAVANAAAELALQGMTAVKLKVAAADPLTDLARVAAARSAIGDDIELRLDANGGWDIDTAIATLHKMAGYNIAFCEEPTAGIGGIAAVGAASGVPVAVDESAVMVSDIATALKTDTVRVVIVKPQALGGPDLALAAVALVEDFGATAVVTTMIDSAIGVAHAAHVAAAVLPAKAHGLATSVLLADDIAPRLEVTAGRIHLPKPPGLGVSPVR